MLMNEWGSSGREKKCFPDSGESLWESLEEEKASCVHKSMRWYKVEGMVKNATSELGKEASCVLP